MRSFPDMLRSQLEQPVAETMGTDAWGLAEADRAVAISQAISLRRIADALTQTHVLEVPPLESLSLEEQQRIRGLIAGIKPAGALR